MKYKIYLLLICVALLCGFALYISDIEYMFDKRVPDNNIGIKLQTEFSKYLLGQKIWVKLKLINNSGSDYYIKEDFDNYGVKFEIKDPNNQDVFNHKNVHILHTDSIKILPGQEYETIFPIDDYINRFNNIEGNYNIKAVFQEVFSNAISLKIETPKEDKEKEYILFSNLFNPTRGINSNLDSIIIDSFEFLNQFPNSIYNPDIYDKILIAHLMSGKKNKVEEIVTKFFNRYPNSFTSRFIIENYYTFLIIDQDYSKIKALEKINSIAKNNKGSESDQIIQNFINKVLITE